jgi:ATP-dependent Clp protease ATP-binding subunit ClpA
MAKKDDKKDKKLPKKSKLFSEFEKNSSLKQFLDKTLKEKSNGPVMLTGSPGTGKSALSTEEAMLEAMIGKKNAPLGDFIAMGSDDDKKSFGDHPELANRLAAIKFAPLSNEVKESVVQKMIERGSYSLSKGASMTKVAAELQKSENKELGTRETLSLLTEKGLLKKAKNKPTKSPKSR